MSTLIKSEIKTLLEKPQYQLTKEEKEKIENERLRLDVFEQEARDKIDGLIGKSQRILASQYISYGFYLKLKFIMPSQEKDDSSKVGTWFEVQPGIDEIKDLIAKLQEYLKAKELYEVTRRMYEISHPPHY